MKIFRSYRVSFSKLLGTIGNILQMYTRDEIERLVKYLRVIARVHLIDRTYMMKENYDIKLFLKIFDVYVCVCGRGKV